MISAGETYTCTATGTIQMPPVVQRAQPQPQSQPQPQPNPTNPPSSSAAATQGLRRLVEGNPVIYQCGGGNENVATTYTVHYPTNFAGQGVPIIPDATHYQMIFIRIVMQALTRLSWPAGDAQIGVMLLRRYDGGMSVIFNSERVPIGAYRNLYTSIAGYLVNNVKLPNNIQAFTGFITRSNGITGFHNFGSLTPQQMANP